MIAARPLTSAEIALRDAVETKSANLDAMSIDLRARQLADDMIDIAAVKGCAEDNDLLLRGWTPEMLAAHGAEANRHALAMSGGGRA